MQPKKSAARDKIVALRKRNYSVYEISVSLKEQGLSLSPTAVREVLKDEGFAPLPRRLDERDRPALCLERDTGRGGEDQGGGPRREKKKARGRKKGGEGQLGL